MTGSDVLMAAFLLSIGLNVWLFIAWLRSAPVRR